MGLFWVGSETCFISIKFVTLFVFFHNHLTAKIPTVPLDSKTVNNFGFMPSITIIGGLQPLKYNKMEPYNDGFQKESPLRMMFRCNMLNFIGVLPPKHINPKNPLTHSNRVGFVGFNRPIRKQ